MIKVKRFKANKRGRDFIVGDLHGCYDDLMRALKAVGFKTRTDRLFCTGDLTDRGPDSLKTAMLVHKRWFHAVKGNHEELIYNWVLHNHYDAATIWFKNGGRWSYGATDEQLSAVAKSSYALPDVIVVGEGENRFNIVHAEFLRDEDDCNVSDEDIDKGRITPKMCERMRWGRSLMGTVYKRQGHNFHKGLSLTYVGHTAVINPLRCQQHLYVDGGCCYFYEPSPRKEGDPEERPRLVIACHQEQRLWEWDPRVKQLSDPIPFTAILDIEVYLQEQVNT